MRIGVIFPEDAGHDGQHIAGMLRTSGLHVSSLIIKPGNGNPGMNKGKRDLLSLLAAFDLPIFVFKSALPRGRLFPFSAGYFFGKKRPVCIFLSDKKAALPLYYRSFISIKDLDELRIFALHENAVWKKNREIIVAKKALLNADLSLNGESFAQCVADGDMESALNFLKAGFSANTRNKKGVPILSMAVRNRHHAMVNLLLEKGAEINAISGDRENTPLMDAASSGDNEILTELIKHKADMDFQNRNGQTALILAIGNGATEAARALIENGANTETADKLGMTARKYAELFRNSEILSYMVDRNFPGR